MRSKEPRPRRRPRSFVLALTGLLGGLHPAPAAAQTCTAPAFTTPSGSRIVPTNVVQPGDVAVGDFNRDGRLDFVVIDAQNPNLEVFLQTPLPAPPGTWSAAGPQVGTGGLPTSVKTADVNRDGRLDVLVSTNGSSQGRVYLGNGGGGLALSATLVTMAGSTTATDIAFLDIDRDGILDVVIADITPAPATNIGLYAFRGNGNGTFQAPVKFDFADWGSIAVTDLDQDGKDDLATTEASNVSPALVTHKGTGTFAPPFSGTFGIGVSNNPLPQFNTVAAGDFDNDGYPDVAVADSTRVQIFLSLGNGQLTGSGQFLLGGALSIQAGDVNLDGNQDLVFVTPVPAGSVGVMLGNGAGAFSPPSLTTFPTTADGIALALGDFNADGRPDVAAANRVGRSVVILLNEFESGCPGASFGPAARAFLAFDPRALATGDFNNDGIRDLVAASTSVNQVTVLNGTSAPGFPGGPTFAPGFGPETSLIGFNAPRAVAVARFNADGFVDLAVANQGAGTVSILQGSAGGFTPLGTLAAVGTAPVDIGTGDFNNDDRRDLAIVNQGSNDVAIRLGNGDGTFSSAPSVTVGSSPVAVAIADFNLDGRPDLAVANFGTNNLSIRLGASGGTFTGSSNPAVGSNPNSLAVGDFNQDGRPDLVVANQGSSNLSILLGNGDGTFSLGVPLNTGGPPTAVVVTRLNGDTLPDIAVAVTSPLDVVRTFLATGLGIFGGPTDYFVGPNPQALAEGDFTQDGRPDLLVGIGGTGQHLKVLVSLGTGALAQAPTASTSGFGPIAVVASDFDLDGDPDLVFANEQSNSLRFHGNNGAGVFTAAPTPIPTSSRPQVLAVADFNRDGRNDLAVAYASSNVQALQGDGLGSFTVFTPPIPAFQARDLASADFDEDGKPDLVLADRSATFARILIGDGVGGFGLTPVNLDSISAPQAVVVGDFDGNGRTDIVVARGGSSLLAVYLNNYDFTPPLVAADFTLVSPDAGQFVTHLAAGDVNRDGKLDLVTNAASGMQVLLGNGTGQFPSSITIDMDGNAVSDIAVAHANNNGTLDVVATEASLGTLSFHLWNGAAGGLTDPVYYAPAAPALSPSALAIADYDGDGKLDFVVANTGSNSYSIYRNTNCTSRRLAMVTEVSTCNVPSVAFATQPRVGIFDDAGYLSRCDTSNVTASIVPGTGTVGAVLSPPPLFVAPGAGVASFNNLSIDLPGQRYRLGFSHPAGGAMSRTFSQGLTAVISGGPLDLCLGQPAVFSAATGYDSYTWTVDPPATPVSFLPNVTLSSLGVGPHTLQLVVTQDGCSALDTESPSVNADLSNVTVSTPGPTTVCTTCVGGTVTEGHSGGGAIVGHQWMWGTASGGPYPNTLPAQTGATYVIDGADFPGPGTYYLVARVLPTCGTVMSSTNEVVVQVQPAVPSDAVKFFTVTSSGTTNTLEWVNPPGRDTVQIRWKSGATSCAYPSDPTGTDGSTFLGFEVGPMGGRDSTTHAVAVNTKYCYTAWVSLGGPFGPGRSNSGRGFATPGAVQWAFSIGTLALVPPGNGNGVVHTVAMDNSLHTVTKGSGGGSWPTSPSVWMPQEMNGPSQGRPAGIPFVAGGATKLIFLGDQAGFVHAFNEETGAEVWVTSPALGDRVVAGASGIFKVFGGFEDMVLVGTYNSSAGNVLYALDPGDGSVLWSYDGNDGIVDHGLIGIISGQPAVDYDAKRVYFASRAFGGFPNDNTVWCVDLTDGKACWAKAHGSIDSGVTLQEDRLFVGTNSGTVLALKKSDGDPAWLAPLVTSNGNVRGYVAADRLTGDIYFSTNSQVWRVQASGASASTIWSVPFTFPSTPVFAPGDSVVYVGGAGSLFKLDVVGGGVVGSFVLGDGTSKVGSPTLDLIPGFAYVGTEAGIVYAVRIP